MSFLIDTCCISELTKKHPDQNVISWFSNQDETEMYVSVITFGELIKGVDKLSASKKKVELNQWINNDLKQRFRNRILDISLTEVKKWGEILTLCENKGTPIPAIDALIAATALVHDLTVVTRNIKDMQPSGAYILNPWKPFRNKET